jgi:GT2 family glycosyltransferase
MASVSVIIPNYNRAALVGDTIRNMLAQTLPPLEVIVVDDGSTDDSAEVIRSFGNSVRLIEQENAGPGAARNRGLAVAAGEYVQFMDSDDLASLNKLDSQVQRLQETGADVVFSPWAKVRIEADQLVFEDHVLQQKMPSSDLPLISHLLRGWSTVLQGLLFRRAAALKAGGFREDVFCLEDIEFLVRVLLSGARPEFTDSCLTFYRSNNADKLTEQATTIARRAADRVRFLELTQEHCNSAGLGLDPVTRFWLRQGFCEAADDLASGGDGFEAVRLRARRHAGFWSFMAGAAVRRLRRLSARLRWQRTGARWLPSYRSSPPTLAQQDLVQAAVQKVMLLPEAV